MKLFGVIDVSTIDYPKKCAAVVFFSECNMLCGYCHNYEQMLNNTVELSTKEVFNNIDLMFADAIVFSGGEPTLQPEALKELCKLSKENNLNVKIDTNGTNIEILKELINNKLVDYIALDVKCKFDKYPLIANYKNINKLKNNIVNLIDYCNKNNVFIECRTTFVPDLMDETDIEEIAKIIKNCNLYTIQQMDCSHSYIEEYKKMEYVKDNKLISLGKIAKKYLNNPINVKSNNGINIVK